MSLAGELREGEPLGGRLSSRNMDTWAQLARALAVALLALATALAAASPARAVDLDEYTGGLRWSRALELDQSSGTGDDEVAVSWWVLVDEDGNRVGEIVSGGTTYLPSGSGPAGAARGFWYRGEAKAGEAISSKAPTRKDMSAFGYIPDSVWDRVDWSAAETSAAQAVDGLGADGDAGPLGEWAQKPIRGYVDGDPYDAGEQYHDAEEPSLGLMDVVNFGDIVPKLFCCMMNVVYRTCVYPLAMMFAGLTDWLLRLADPTLFFKDSYFTGDYSSFYEKAKLISDGFAAPYAKVFLAIMFTLTLLDPARPRGRMFDDDRWLEHWVTNAALALIGCALIDHAVDAVGWIYMYGTYMAKAAAATVSSSGGLSALGSDIIKNVCTTGQTLTYGNLWLGVVLLVIGFGLAKATFTCVKKILVVSVMRIGEIYLRASLAAIPFAALAGGDEKHTAARYLQRLLAVCVQAALIVVALSMMGPIYDASRAILTALVANASVEGFSSVTSLMKTMIPPVVAVALVTAIIDKTEQVAGDMFGYRG